MSSHKFLVIAKLFASISSSNSSTERARLPARHHIISPLNTNLVKMQNAEGDVVDLYIPRKWYVSVPFSVS